jgi:hypothetical protein
MTSQELNIVWQKPELEEIPCSSEIASYAGAELPF